MGPIGPQPELSHSTCFNSPFAGGGCARSLDLQPWEHNVHRRIGRSCPLSMKTTAVTSTYAPKIASTVYVESVDRDQQRHQNRDRCCGHGPAPIESALLRRVGHNRILRQLLKSDGMRRPVSGRDAERSQVIDVLKAQIKRRPARKKVSTVGTPQTRNISQQKLTLGLDLGDRNSWYCVLDEAGQI